MWLLMVFVPLLLLYQVWRHKPRLPNHNLPVDVQPLPSVAYLDRTAHSFSRDNPAVVHVVYPRYCESKWTRLCSTFMTLLVQVVVDKTRFHKIWKIVRPAHWMHVMLHVVMATVMSLCLSHGSNRCIHILLSLVSNNTYRNIVCWHGACLVSCVVLSPTRDRTEGPRCIVTCIINRDCFMAWTFITTTDTFFSSPPYRYRVRYGYRTYRYRYRVRYGYRSGLGPITAA